MLSKFLRILSCLFFVSMASYAQNTNSVSGKVFDASEDASVQHAVVILMDSKDSSIVAHTRVDVNGNYELKNIPDGNYTVIVTHPVFADYVEEIQVAGRPVELISAPLTQKAKLLDEVIVRTSTGIRIKGDTTIYAADSFAVGPNANVEELLKKLPGIQVDKNGEIKAMGQTVQKVLVDGEEFFGDDPGMAVKNLRADAVKEVQVFDKKSDQAQFTGIDDGNTQKTINLKLKEDKKKGYFGKVELSGGLLNDYPNRFNNNIMLSSFKGKRKISGFVLNGNTGQDGLSWQDREKFGGNDDNMTTMIDEESGGVMFIRQGGSVDDEPVVDTRNGFITNINAGIQYTNKWNEKHNLNVSPRYNYQDYENLTSVFSQTAIGDSLLIENSSRETDVKRYNFKNSAIYEAKIDSNRSLKLTLKANFYHTESEEFRLASSETGGNVLVNTTERSTSSVNDKSALGGTLLYRHKFKKDRRTLSVQGSWNRIEGESDFLLKSLNQNYIAGMPAYSIEQNQLRNSNSVSNNLSTKIAYTEPLSKNYAIELGYNFSWIGGKNDQVTYSYSPVSGKYDVVLDSLTNDFEQSIFEHRPSVKVSYNTKKLNYNFGVGVGIVDYNLEDKTINTKYDRNFNNYFPSAMLTYKYKSNSTFRMSYNGSTQQPTINQLQPLRQNDNYYSQYIGNPDLKTTFNHRFEVSHMNYNFLKESWTYGSVNFTFADNSITYSRTILLDSGKTIMKPINTDGNINLFVWTGGGFKWKKPNIRVNIQPNFMYNKYAEVINDVKSFAKNSNFGLNLGLQKDKAKVYDFGINNNVRYNQNKSTIATNSVQYWSNTLALNATVYYKKKWSLSTDFNYDWREGINEMNKPINISLWNARLQRTFKNDEFTAYISIRDILNQNKGIDRNMYSSVYTESINERLKRYWMVGFAWNFKNK